MKNQIFFRSQLSWLFLGLLLGSCTPDAADKGVAGTAAVGERNDQPVAAADQGPSDAVEYGDDAFSSDPAFVEMQTKGYLKLMRGEWRSNSSPGLQLSFGEGTFERKQDGRVVRQGSVRLDATCQESDCSGGKGWCFMEVTASGTACFWVRRIDQRTLVVRHLGTGLEEVFSR
ncbi:MAG: hypothetical protein RLY31_1195 [Bacteroidota bacterium]|jgi:hypothetical protein